MKTLKIFAGIVAVVIAVIAIVVVIGLQNLDKIIKTAVEEVGSQVLSTAVQLDTVEIQLTNGRGELHGLSIANPKGFSDTSAISLGEITLEIDPESLGKEVIVINEILINNAHLLAEFKSLKENNLQSLLNNLDSGSGSDSNTGKNDSSTDDTPADNKSTDIKLAVKKFTFSESSIRLLSEQFGEKTLSLSKIELLNVGSATNGLSPEQLTTTLMGTILSETKKAVQRAVKKLAKGKAKDKLKEKLSEKLDADDLEKLNELKSLFKR